jgi:hypothetical protein
MRTSETEGHKESRLAHMVVGHTKGLSRAVFGN